ncbi:hypothetical protein GCM10010377_79960 [Streptomyces viridiviolaceus]|nr:hypothetical protein GCM10010377_79960 [Streptomyces viridiviolaceus]
MQINPAVKVQYGLYDVSGGRRQLCGVAVFGVPVSTAVLTRPLPHLRPYTQAVECHASCCWMRAP